MALPVIVNVPPPTLLKLVAPVPSVMLPENVVFVFKKPVLTTADVVGAAVVPEFVTVPAPDNDPRLLATPIASIVAPLSTVYAEYKLDEPSANVPN